ncbi:RNA polymerase sigma-70 factor [Olivibacter sp. XZL3]|uniref:RNA polymerase sigma-70 factor n=1 Tax=Olivibacter sp. XZL3 TaxID=1735116 RepID=UPI0010650CBA|nr:RNA polymerase sigma-70 factor [Olivibacter sp. XZL3]
MSDLVSTEQVFKSHYKKLCHFAWQLLDDKALVEDIVQDAFIAYWDDKNLLIENEIAIKNYLYSTVRHACYNVARRNRVIARYWKESGFEDWEEEQVLACILRAEVLDEIQKAVETLPKGCQEIFRLGYLDGLSNMKIAQLLGISINTVKTQKQRGLKVLKGRLRPELLTFVLYFCQ